jgi:hypothetical protein
LTNFEIRKIDDFWYGFSTYWNKNYKNYKTLQICKYLILLHTGPEEKRSKVLAPTG